MGMVVGMLVAWVALSLFGLAITVALSNAGAPDWAALVPALIPIVLAYPAARWGAGHLHGRHV